MIDAADEADRIIAACEGLEVQAILTTHGHADHIQAVDEVKAAFDVPFLLHPADREIAGRSFDGPLHDGQEYQVGTVNVHVLHTPGHTPGSVSFVVEPIIFSGDTLFPGGPGATRWPYSSFGQIMSSVEQKLMAYPDPTVVYPGHGSETTIGNERPHLRGMANSWLVAAGMSRSRSGAPTRRFSPQPDGPSRTDSPPWQLPDHYLSSATDLEEPAWDSLIHLAGLARETKRIELIDLVSPITFRHPAVYAKTAVTLSDMSDGRFWLGLGTGWMEEEHRLFGFAFPDTGERFLMLEEALGYLDALTHGIGFEGTYYRLESVRGIAPFRRADRGRRDRPFEDSGSRGALRS